MTEDNSISVEQLVKILWDKRIFVGKCIAAFLFVGVIVAFFSPKEYTSYTIVLPEKQNGAGLGLAGSLSGLAGVAGIDLTGVQGEEGIAPQLFPEVLASTRFLTDIAAEEFYFSEIEKTITLGEYVYSYLKNPVYQPKLFVRDPYQPEAFTGKNNSIIALSIQEYSILEKIDDRISVSLNKKSGLVRISAKFQDPSITAAVTQYSLDYLKEYISDYNTTKEKKVLDFVSQRFLEAEEEFKKKSKLLIEFREDNKNIILERVKNQEKMLVSEYNFANSLMMQLAEKREQSRLDVLNTTPIFEILEPVKLPIEKSEPRRGRVLLGSLLVGFILASLIILSKELFSF